MLLVNSFQLTHGAKLIGESEKRRAKKCIYINVQFDSISFILFNSIVLFFDLVIFLKNESVHFDCKSVTTYTTILY